MEYLTFLIMNCVVVAGSVYLVTHDHPVVGVFLLIIGLMIYQDAST